MNSNLKKVAKRILLRTRRVGSCLLWKGATDQKGYGQIRYRKRGYRVHRVIHQVAVGKRLRKGILVCHSCDVTSCVEEAHLFSGTAKTNTLDMMRKGRNKGQFKKGELKKRKNLRLTPTIARTIRKLYASGTTQVSLARRYNTRQGHISNIVHHRSWITA